MSTHPQSGVETAQPTVGARVFTNEGNELGRIKTVQGGYFELDVRMAQDYWLSCTYVQSAGTDRVDLNISSPEAEEHRLTRPGLDASDMNSASNVDHVLSDDEALAQRERMERELLAQRGRLDSGLRE